MRQPAEITGRCYCGAKTVAAAALPKTVVYCHCKDCRRVTGAALPAFAGFNQTDFAISPDPGPGVSFYPGVERWFCKACGSQLAAKFDYLPDQVYAPIGILDQADDLRPTQHCHYDARLAWLDLNDGLERHQGSGRNTLNAGS